MRTLPQFLARAGVARIKFLFCITLLASPGVQESQAGELYQLERKADSSWILKSLDLESGIETEIGETLAMGGGVWSLDFSPAGRLYGLQTVNGWQVSRLWEFDLETGAATLVRGDFYGAYAGTLAISEDGTFIGSHTAPSGERYLVTIDPYLVIKPERIGVEALPKGAFLGGIDISPDGTLYGLSQSDNALYTVDRATGAGTLVGSLGLDFSGNDLALTCDEELGLLATAIVDSVDPSDPYGRPYGPSLLRIDPATGEAVVIRSLTGNVAAAAFGVCPPADTDGDEIPDYEDHCPDSDLSDTVSIGGIDTGVTNLWGVDLVNADGCSLADEVACALGLAAEAATEPDVKGSKGKFTAAMAQFFEALVEEGVILEVEQDVLQDAVAFLTLAEIAALEVPEWCE